MSIIPSTAITIDGDTAWLVVECPPDSAPANWEQADKQCDTCNGYPGPTQFEPRTCCDGTGRHCFTLHVECVLPMCVNGQRGYWQDGHPCGYCNATGTSQLSVHVVAVLPIIEWDTVDLGLPHPVPCMTVDPHGNGLEVTERDAHDYFGIDRNLPDDTAPGMFAIRLAIHKAQA